MEDASCSAPTRIQRAWPEKVEAAEKDEACGKLRGLQGVTVSTPGLPGDSWLASPPTLRVSVPLALPGRWPSRTAGG